MIIWLASYPKSGNTLLRSILAAYFYSEDGVVKFKDLYNIEQFPEIKHFRELKIDLSNEKKVFENFINAQVNINKKNLNISQDNNQLIVRFFTNEAINTGHGFRARWRSECGGYFNQPGIIQLGINYFNFKTILNHFI